MAVRNWRLVVLCLVPLAFSGCTLWHELQPHRLHRLNRVSPPHLDPEFTLRESLTDEPVIVRAQNETDVTAD